MSRPAALFVGDVSADLTLSVDHVPAPDEKVHVLASRESAGGVVANAAVACAKAAAATRMLLQMGDDLGAGFVRGALAAAGVAVEGESRAGRTCQVVVLLEPHGEKRLLLDPGVSMYPSLAQVERVDLTGVGWMHTAAYGLAADRLVERCRAADIPWSVDLEPASFADGLSALSELLAGAAVVFCNARAAQQIGAAPVETLFAMGVRSIVFTLGADGARLVEPAGPAAATVRSPVRPLVRDTTGAGDCLAGWFVAQRLAGATAAAALEVAVLAAAFSCEHVGAQTSYPTPRSLQEFRARAQALRFDEKHED